MAMAQKSGSYQSEASFEASEARSCEKVYQKYLLNLTFCVMLVNKGNNIKPLLNPKMLFLL